MPNYKKLKNDGEEVPHWKVEEQPNKRPKKGGDKSAVATVKDVRQLGCASQDVEPPESSTITRKGTKILGPIRRVRFSRAVLRPGNIRESKGPSLNEIQVKLPHQRSPYAVKFEDRSQEDKSDAPAEMRGDLPRNICKLKEREKATFYSPSDEWVLPAASTIKPEEREFVVDSGPSMHMVSRIDLTSAELETVSTSESPTTMVTAGNSVCQRIGFIRDIFVFFAKGVFLCWFFHCLAARRKRGICFLSLFFSRGLFLLCEHQTHEKDSIQGPFVQDVAMVERGPLERTMSEAMVV